MLDIALKDVQQHKRRACTCSEETSVVEALESWVSDQIDSTDHGS